MTSKAKEEAGFVGAKLVKGGDRTLHDRFIAELASDTELDQSKLIRIALKEYFERKDNKN